MKKEGEGKRMATKLYQKPEELPHLLCRREEWADGEPRTQKTERLSDGNTQEYASEPQMKMVVAGF